MYAAFILSQPFLELPALVDARKEARDECVRLLLFWLSTRNHHIRQIEGVSWCADGCSVGSGE